MGCGVCIYILYNYSLPFFIFMSCKNFSIILQFSLLLSKSYNCLLHLNFSLSISYMVQSNKIWSMFIGTLHFSHIGGLSFVIKY